MSLTRRCTDTRRHYLTRTGSTFYPRKSCSKGTVMTEPGIERTQLGGITEGGKLSHEVDGIRNSLDSGKQLQLKIK